MSEERFDLPPVTGGDYLKILVPGLTIGNRRLEVGEVVPVSLVSPGVAVMLVDAKQADWRKTAGADASGTGG